MATVVHPAFELQGLHIPVERLLPMKSVNTDEKKNAVFRRVLAAIKELNLIEPVIVYPQSTGKAPNYSILDGHTRFEAMKKLSYTTIPCLIATEDEAFTYNHKVNVVPPIQEHLMILKAIQSGVSEERIAKALDIDVASIRQKRDLLNGICPEAIEILKTKTPGRETFREMRKVKPMRQIEMAELMVKTHTFTNSYAKFLLAATPDDQLVDPHKPKAPKGVLPTDNADMQKEMESLEQNFLALDESLGHTSLHLVLSSAYLRRMTGNSAVARYLSNKHAEIFAELKKLIETTSLERAG